MGVLIWIAVRRGLVGERNLTPEQLDVRQIVCDQCEQESGEKRTREYPEVPSGFSGDAQGELVPADPRTAGRADGVEQVKLDDTGVGECRDEHHHHREDG